MRLATYLWLGTGKPPAEYVRFVLIQLYKCRPSELYDEDPQDIADDLMCMQMEQRVAGLRQKKATNPNHATPPTSLLSDSNG